jgi:hypothetical protein
MYRNTVFAASIVGMSFLFAPSVSLAHSWYSQRQDPVYRNGCCGGSDCSKIDGSWLTQEEAGYRVRLTVDQARAVNPNASYPVNAMVGWNRVQISEDGNFHLCIFTFDRSLPFEGVICLFVPPNS